MGLGWHSGGFIGAWSVLLVACSSARQPNPRDVIDANDTGRAVQARSETEREILRRLPQLRDGVESIAGSARVVADASYAAASGRTCRTLHVKFGATGRAKQRLVCNDGSAWFFVPEVGLNASPE